jgi:hypothetical protein
MYRMGIFTNREHHHSLSLGLQWRRPFDEQIGYVAFTPSSINVRDAFITVAGESRRDDSAISFAIGLSRPRSPICGISQSSRPEGKRPSEGRQMSNLPAQGIP